MLKALKEIGQATPFPWLREPEEVNMAAVSLILTAAIGLILTTRLRIYHEGITSGALAAFLPSALGFAVFMCIGTGLGLRYAPRTRLGLFLPLTARCFRLFTLAMLLTSAPFLLREVGWLPDDFLIGRATLEGSTPVVPLSYQRLLTLLYTSVGIAMFWIIVLSRRHSRLVSIQRLKPTLIKRSPRFVIEPLLIGGAVSFVTLLTTHVTLWADLPAWLAIIKVG